MKLKEFTIEEMRQLKGNDKVIAMKRYREWQKKQREQDKREINNLIRKVRNFLGKQEDEKKTNTKEE